MKDLIQYISASLVDDPTQVEVSQFRRGGQMIVQLRVAKEDMGRIIGKNGRVATGMRTLLKVASTRENKRVSLDILEPD